MEADEVGRVLGRLRGRVPPLPRLPEDDLAEASRALRALVRDSGRELRRLRFQPRSQTAPLARFREGCRAALAALRGFDRCRRRLEAARRRLGGDLPREG